MPDSTATVTNGPQGEVDEKVLEIIAKALDAEPGKVTPSTALEGDLGAESLDYLDIAFMLEREFNIQFPRTDFMERAAEHFGEENLVKNGVLTSLGLQLLAKGMPELDQAQLKPGLKVNEVRRMFVAGTFIRVTKRLIESRQSLDHTCAKCGAEMEESSNSLELVCAACGEVKPFPSGDDILFQDLLALEKDGAAPPQSAAGEERTG